MNFVESKKMMPRCAYKGCRKIAEVKLGTINTGEKDGFGNDWPKTVYVCKKCRKKICEKLGLSVKEEE